MEYSQEGVTNVPGAGAGRNWPVTRPLKDRARLEASFWPHFQEFGGGAWAHEEGGATCQAACPRSIRPPPAIVSPRSEAKLLQMRTLRLGAAQASRHTARTRPWATGLPGTDVPASFRASVSPAESGPPAPTVPDVSGGDDRCDGVDLCHETALRFRRLSAPPRKHASLPRAICPRPPSRCRCADRNGSRPPTHATRCAEMRFIPRQLIPLTNGGSQPSTGRPPSLQCRPGQGGASLALQKARWPLPGRRTPAGPNSPRIRCSPRPPPTTLPPRVPTSGLGPWKVLGSSPYVCPLTVPGTSAAHG